MCWEEKLPSVVKALEKPGNEFALLANSLKDFAEWVGDIAITSETDKHDRPVYYKDINELLIKNLKKVVTKVQENLEIMQKYAGDDWIKYQNNLRESGIFEELKLAGQLLKSNEESRESKVEKGEIVTNSIKDLLKKPFEWWAPKWVQDLIDSLFKIIDELLKLLK